MPSSTNLARPVNEGQLGKEMHLSSPHLYKQQQNKQTHQKQTKTNKQTKNSKQQIEKTHTL